MKNVTIAPTELTKTKNLSYLEEISNENFEEGCLKESEWLVSWHGVRIKDKKKVIAMIRGTGDGERLQFKINPRRENEVLMMIQRARQSFWSRVVQWLLAFIR